MDLFFSFSFLEGSLAIILRTSKRQGHHVSHQSEMPFFLDKRISFSFSLNESLNNIFFAPSLLFS